MGVPVIVLSDLTMPFTRCHTPTSSRAAGVMSTPEAGGEELESAGSK